MPTKTSTIYRGVTWSEIQDIGTSRSTSRYSRVVLLNRSRTGEANPKWRQQVKRAQQAGTALTATESTLDIKPGKAVVMTDWGAASPIPPYFKDVYAVTEGEAISPLYPPTHSPMNATSATNQALSRLYAALRQERTHAQAIVSAGELPETLKAISDTAQKLGRAFASVRKAQLERVAKYVGSFYVDQWGNPRRTRDFMAKYNRLKPKAKKKLRHELGDVWLSYSLGLAPLVGEAKSLAETVARWNFEKDAEKHTWSSKIRGFGEDERTLGASMTKYFGFGGLEYYEDRRHFNKVKVIYRAGLYPDFDAPQVGSAHRLYQLLGAYTPENWIPSVWNLLPLSFIFDYFNNVADVCTALLTDTTRVAWVVKTLISSTEIEVHGIVPHKRTYVTTIGTKPCYKTQSGSLGSYKTTTRQVFRTLPAGFTPPTVQFELPVRPVQVANLIALVTGTRPKSSFT